MINPFSSPRSDDSEIAREKPARLRLFTFQGLAVGLVLYFVRAMAVLSYSRNASDIGGPQVDAGQMAWIPFFVVDVPWSLMFDNLTYSSDRTAVGAYSFAVGLPWVLYGMGGLWLIKYLHSKFVA